MSISTLGAEPHRQTYLGNNRSGSYGASLANGPARQDDGTATNPAILLYDNRSAKLRALSSLTFLRVNGKGGSEDADVGTEDTVVSDLDLADIVDGTISSNDDVVADRNVIAIITHKGGFNGNMATDPSNICNRRRLSGRHTDRISRL